MRQLRGQFEFDLLFAAVSATGTVSASRPSTGVTASVTGSTYTVNFGKDVSKCSFTASPLGPTTPGAPGVAPTAGTVNAVGFIKTSDLDGSVKIVMIDGSGPGQPTYKLRLK